MAWGCHSTTKHYKHPAAFFQALKISFIIWAEKQWKSPDLWKKTIFENLTGITDIIDVTNYSQLPEYIYILGMVKFIDDFPKLMGKKDFLIK